MEGPSANGQHAPRHRAWNDGPPSTPCRQSSRLAWVHPSLRFPFSDQRGPLLMIQNNTGGRRRFGNQTAPTCLRMRNGRRAGRLGAGSVIGSSPTRPDNTGPIRPRRGALRVQEARWRIARSAEEEHLRPGPTGRPAPSLPSPALGVLAPLRGESGRPPPDRLGGCPRRGRRESRTDPRHASRRHPRLTRAPHHPGHEVLPETRSPADAAPAPASCIPTTSTAPCCTCGSAKPPVRTGRGTKGILLYPQVGAEPLRAEVWLEGFRIQARTVDLNQDWRLIHEEMLGVIGCAAE